MEEALKIISKINTTIINPIILILFAIALVYFLAGILQYMFLSRNDPSAVSAGAKHMGWGLLGMFIMISVFGLMKILINTIPVDPETKDSVNKVIPLN